MAPGKGWAGRPTWRRLEVLTVQCCRQPRGPSTTYRPPLLLPASYPHSLSLFCQSVGHGVRDPKAF